MRVVETLTLLAGVAVMCFALPHQIAGDGGARYLALVKLVEHHHVENIKCSYLMSLLAIPLYLAGKAAGDPQAWCGRFNVLLTVLGLAAVYALLRRRIERGVLLRFFVLLLAASMWANHLRGFYGELLTATLVLVGGLLLACERRLAGWMLLVLGTVNSPACGGGLALAALSEAWRTRRLRHLLAVVAAGGLIVLERYVQTGQIFVTGYEGDRGFKTMMPYSGQVGFSYPFIFGVASILFSLGKGLLFFAPGLVLSREVMAVPSGIDARDSATAIRDACRVWLLYLVGMVLVYSKWWAWYGGWCWGPRFFLLASVPASLALAVRLSRRDASLAGAGLTLLVLALSLWVGVSGAVYDTRTLEMLMSKKFAAEVLTWYTPEFSVLGRPLVQPAPLSPHDWMVAGYCVAAVAVAAGPWALSTVRRLIQGVRTLVADAKRAWRF